MKAKVTVSWAGLHQGQKAGRKVVPGWIHDETLNPISRLHAFLTSYHPKKLYATGQLLVYLTDNLF